MSNSSSTTESSSLTGKKFRSFRNRNGPGFFSWPSDLKFPGTRLKPRHDHDHDDDNHLTEKHSDLVYLTLKEAAARGRTSSMSSEVGRRRIPRRGRPRRRCSSEPRLASKYSPKPFVGFSGAVDSVVARCNPVRTTSRESVRPKLVSNSESRFCSYFAGTFSLNCFGN